MNATAITYIRMLVRIPVYLGENEIEAFQPSVLLMTFIPRALTTVPSRDMSYTTPTFPFPNLLLFIFCLFEIVFPKITVRPFVIGNQTVGEIDVLEVVSKASSITIVEVPNLLEVIAEDRNRWYHL